MSPPACRVVLPFGLTLVLAFALFSRAEAAPPARDAAPASIEERVASLEGQIEALKKVVESVMNRSSGPSLMALLLCAAFCALWAQNTNRNPWLWYFLGLFFNFITLFVLLWKNSKDKRVKAHPPKEEVEFHEPACV
jgi:hypothetical protein